MIRNDFTPTTDASSNKRGGLVSAEIFDSQIGGAFQGRKKVAQRIDVALESRGSIFTGRDEHAILL